MNRVDAAAIAEALNVTSRWVHIRATREAWPFTEAPVRGGRKRLYVVACLPADARRSLVRAARKRGSRITLYTKLERIAAQRCELQNREDRIRRHLGEKKR
jgi:hypothetical protein